MDRRVTLAEFNGIRRTEADVGVKTPDTFEEFLKEAY